jgi:hypothetical protein
MHLFSHGHQFHGRPLNEYEILLSSWSLQEEAANASGTLDMSRGFEGALTSPENQ